MTIKRTKSGTPSPVKIDNPNTLEESEKTILNEAEKSKIPGADDGKDSTVTPPLQTDSDVAVIGADTAAVLIEGLFTGLGNTINPVWKLKPDESKSLAESLKAAYPTLDLGSWAKAFFWVNLTIIVVPRALVTMEDMLGKNKKQKANNEIDNNSG